MEITVPHQVEYEVPGPVSVDEIIATLQANADLFQEIGPLIERALPGLTIERITLHVREIHHGSLRELFLAALVVAFQEDLKTKIPPVVEGLFGVDVPSEYDTLVTITVLLLLFYGADFLYKITTKNLGSGKLKDQLNGMIKEMSVKCGLSEKEIRDFLESRYGKPSRIKKLAEATGKFFRPSRRQGNSAIIVGHKRIEQDVVAEVPSDVQIEAIEKLSTSELIPNVEIELHAKDKDREKTGWAGVIPSISKKRLRMLLNPPIEPADVWGKEVIQGDVMLIREQKGDEFEPVEFHLTRITKH
jgi:hypothetical protein